jgi:signal transduction histidine kinase
MASGGSAQESEPATPKVPGFRNALTQTASRGGVAVDWSSSTVETLRSQILALQRVCSVGVLASGVFHELNNALTPILNYAKLGLRNQDPVYRERALTQIVAAAQRAAAITQGMLSLSRSGDKFGHREPTDLSRLLEEVVSMVQKDLSRHQVRLEVKVTAKPSARVNRAQIQQVLLNLLINARQAIPGGGTVRLWLGQDATGRLAELSVSDDGVGIAPADLPRIFEPFYSTKAGPDAGGQGGTGLGLAVSRDIVESHHGRLRAESRPGHGSTFTIILPACQPPAAGAGQQGAA